MVFKDKYIDIHMHQETHMDDRVGVLNIYPDKIPELKSDGFYSMGLHPWIIPEKGVGKLIEVIEEYARKPEIVAIGECGLDKLSNTPLDVQQFVFEKQVEIADKVQKPLIIHCVRSFNELVQIKVSTNSTVEWVVHGLNANMQIADMLLRHEMYLSFGKALLNPDSNASKLLPQLEDEEYLLETDDSDTGIDEVYKAAAETLNMDMDILKLSMQTNFINCFKV